MERTTTNSLVPFQPFQLGRMKLRRCLHAMMAFVGYAWSRLLYDTAVRLRSTVVWGHIFFFFPRTWLFLHVIDCHHCCSLHVHPAANPYPKRNFLSTERVFTQGNTHGFLSPERLWYVSQASFFFQPPICSIRVHVI